MPMTLNRFITTRKIQSYIEEDQDIFWPRLK